MRKPNPEAKNDWISYVINGVERHEGVSEAVLASWKRSKAYGLDPYKPYDDIFADDLEERIEKNRELIRFSAPVLNYIAGTNTSFYRENVVAITDKEAIHIFTVALPSMERFCHGLNAQERYCGTNGVNLVLREDQPIEIGGYEKFRRSMHSLIGGCAPIHGKDGAIEGVITFFNQFDKIPEQPIEMLIYASKMIECAMNLGIVDCYAKSNLFQSFIDCVPQKVMVFDEDGVLCSLNQQAKDFLRLNNSYIGKTMDEFSIDAVIRHVEAPVDFQIKVNGQRKNCILQNNRWVEDLDGKKYLLVLFQQKLEAKEQVKTPIVIRTDYPWNNLAGFDKIIGNAPLLVNALKMAYRATQVSANVLIEGESGTGKEMFAQAISLNSGRSGPFVAVNCGAIPRELLQSELFGYEGGSFTGAQKSGKVGKFEAANGGTLFLDEIGEMPLDMQVNLLRAIQEQKIMRVGGVKEIPVDVRIIAATNRNVMSAVHAGTFREDLYYRLNVINIKIPPLRERASDIPVLVEHFLEYYKQMYNFQNLCIPSDVVEALSRYSWPGNVRELSNLMHTMVIFADSDMLRMEQLPPYITGGAVISSPPPVAPQSKKSMKEIEKDSIVAALNQSGGNVTKAAEALGMGRNTLYRKIKQYDIIL